MLVQVPMIPEAPSMFHTFRAKLLASSDSAPAINEGKLMIVNVHWQYMQTMVKNKTNYNIIWVNYNISPT